MPNCVYCGTEVDVLAEQVPLCPKCSKIPLGDVLASAMQYSDEAIITEELNGRVTSWNKNAERIFGYAAHEIIGRHISILAPRNQADGISALAERVCSVGRLEHHQTVGETKDGRLLNISLTASPMKDREGRIVGVSQIARDITEKVRANERLAELNEAKEDLSGLKRLHEFSTKLVQANDLTSLLNELLTAARAITNADMGNIQLVDSDGELRIAAHHGFPDEYVTFFNRVNGHQSSSCSVALSTRERVIVEDVERSPIFAGTEALQVQLRASVRAVQSTPIVNRSGVLAGVFSTHYKSPHRPSERDLRLIDLLAREAADLIEKARAEESLRAAHAELEMITDNMAAAVSRCTRDLEYKWVSREYAAWLGRAPGDIAGRSIREVIGAEAYKTIFPYVQRVLSGEKVDYTSEVAYLGSGPKWVHAVYVPTYSDGSVDGWIAVVEDITDTVCREKQLREANINLARANEDLNHFAFAASHDLQEPLRMITAYSQLLIRGYGKEQQTDSALYIDFIREGTHRMQELLKDLLTYTQMGNQPWNRSIETIDLNSVQMEVIDDCRHLIEETEARVTRDHLPRVSGDERHFAQLFANLITNALKYRAECPPRIHISATIDRNMWRLGVADNGIGIAPEHHESIFRPFKRLHGKDIPGTGVGLAICRRVVEQYGGRIWVESDIGQGSTFYFTLPAVQVSAAHD